MTASILRQTEFPHAIRGSMCLFPTARIKRAGQARRCGVGEDRLGCNGGWQRTSWKCNKFRAAVYRGYSVEFFFSCCLPYRCRNTRHEASEGQLIVQGETLTPELCCRPRIIDWSLEKVTIRKLVVGFEGPLAGCV